MALTAEAQKIAKGYVDPLGITFSSYATPKITRGGGAAGENPYSPRVGQALAGMRDRPSASGVLGGLANERAARAAHVATRGADPITAAVGLGRLTPALSQTGGAVGRAAAAEQNMINNILRGTFGESAKRALARAQSHGDRRAIVMDVEAGLEANQEARMARSLALQGQTGAQIAGKYKPGASRSTDPLSSDYNWGTYTTDVYEGGQDTYRGPRDYSVPLSEQQLPDYYG